MWDRIEEGSTKISFEKFLSNMKQYQYESNDEKLKSTHNYVYCFYGNRCIYYTGYFDWINNDNDQITRDRLKTIIHHATNDQDEVVTLLLYIIKTYLVSL